MAQITRKQSNLPLKCVLAGNIANVRITGAVSTDSAGNSQNLVVSADQQSFTVQLNTLGKFFVTAVVDGLPSGPSPELRASDDNTLLDLFDDPATLAADFQLAVIP